MSAEFSLRELGEATQRGVLILCCIYAAVLFVFAPALLLEKTLRAEWQDTDFRSFYSAAVQLRQAADGLYHQGSQEYYQSRVLSAAGLPPPEAYFSFRYPAAFLLFFLPLSTLSPSQGYLIASAALGLLAVLCVYLLNREYRPGPFGLLLLGFVPLYVSIYHTQLSVLLLLMLLLAEQAMKRRQYWRAGSYLGLLLLKPQIGLVICSLLALVMPQLLLPIAVSALLLLLLSYLMAPQAFLEYPAALFEYQQSARLHDRAAEAMISWQGFATQLSHYFAISNSSLAAVLTVLTLLASALIFHRRRSELSPSLLMASAACCALLAAWHVHLHDAVLALPALCTLRARLAPRHWRYLLLCVSLLYGLAYYTLLRAQPMPFVGTVASLLLLLVLLRRTHSENLP